MSPRPASLGAKRTVAFVPLTETTVTCGSRRASRWLAGSCLIDVPAAASQDCAPNWSRARLTGLMCAQSAAGSSSANAFRYPVAASCTRPGSASRPTPSASAMPAPTATLTTSAISSARHRLSIGEGRGVARRAADDVVGRAVREQTAVAHAVVAGLRVVGDDRERRLLGDGRVAVGDLEVDLVEAQELLDLQVLGLIGHRGVAPAVPAALADIDPEVVANPPVQPLGQALGGLDAEAVDEELLRELALGLELGHQLGHLVADRDGLDGDDVELA